MKTRIASYRPIAVARGGFTLIEMLVATTLVVMMMLMFAQIYVAAIDSLGEQQALARNDGKARLADILLRGDLDRTSFHGTPNSSQGLLPLVKDDPVSQWQRGFFYISENDQSNPNDDVLHFTASIKEARSRDSAMYYGRAKDVASTNGTNILLHGTSGSSPEFSNHPEVDDGDMSNDVGASRDAEICYFVRGGNLYRRVLLIRDIDLAGVPGANTAQPSNGSTEFSDPIIPSNVPGDVVPSYYKSFDYAAICRITDVSNDMLDEVRFLGTDALQNQPQNSSFSTESLGCSMTRFGHAISEGNQVYANATDVTLQAINRARGTSVEFDSTGNFFGRPLHGETGSHQWQWPGTRYNPLNGVIVYSPNTNQMSVGGTLIEDPDKLQTRATEDLLLSGVEAFDIEVWDPGLVEIDPNGNGILEVGENGADLNGNGFFDTAGGFVQLGNNSSTGYFRDAQRLNPFYGPGESDANGNGSLDAAEDRNSNGVFDYSSVFDTGHPEMWTEETVRYDYSAPPPTPLPIITSRGQNFRPPYRPLMYRLNEDTDGNGTLNAVEDLDGDGVIDPAPFPVVTTNFWSASTNYSPGAVVFKVDGLGIGDTTFSTAYRCVASGEDLDGDSYPDTEDANGNNSLDPGEDMNNNNQLDVEDANGNSSVVLPIDQGFTGATAPEWPSVPGHRVLDGGVTWEAFDNRIGLQKIRITIRVRDPREQLPRQFSIIHSFANPTKLN